MKKKQYTQPTCEVVELNVQECVLQASKVKSLTSRGLDQGESITLDGSGNPEDEAW